MPAAQRRPCERRVAGPGRIAEPVERPLGRPELAHDLEPVLVGSARAPAVTGHKPTAMASSHQRIRKIPNEPLATAPLLGPENMAGKPNPDGRQVTPP